MVRKNIIFEKERFTKRCQLLNKSTEQFITEIHRLGETCEFGPMKEELIRDCLVVVGIRDHALSEHLQIEAELTLDKVKRLIRQRKVVKEQQEVLKQPNKEDISLDTVAKQAHRGKLPRIPPPTMRQPLVENCRRCGKGPHPRQSCPAKNVMCYCCNRKGHYSAQCLSNTVAPQTMNVHESLKSVKSLTVRNI